MSATRLLLLLACLLWMPTNAAAETEAEPWLDRKVLGFEESVFGDLDAMLERGSIVALVPYSRTQFFLDGNGRPRGVAYDALEEFARGLQRKGEVRSKRVHVAYVVVPRDELIAGIAEGRGDIAVGNLTITPEREERVDFTPPIATGIREVVVTGPAGPGGELDDEGDLAGLKVTVRPSSSYYRTLLELNERLEERGLVPVAIQAADENLDTGDLLEMVNAGLLAATVADDHVAKLWGAVLPELVVHGELPLASGLSIGWAFRKDSPLLAAALADFVETHKEGTLYGNTLTKRYFESTRWVKGALRTPARGRFELYKPLFQKYGARYDFDWRLLAAQSYQESGFNPDAVSRVGAIGLMQLLPSTAASPEVGIPDVTEPEPNVHAGAKYMRWIVRHYFSDGDLDPLNQHLFALAAYNAGAGRVRSARRDTEKLGLDPDEWYDNVEVLVGRRAGREPVDYVSNIYKYYVAYNLAAGAAEKAGQAYEKATAVPEATDPPEPSPAP